MIKLGPTMSIATLNVNGRHTPIKRTILSDWILKRIYYMLCTRDPL